MTLEEMQKQAFVAEEHGTDVVLSMPKKRPAGFPRGELLCDNERQKIYAFDALKLLAWIRKARNQARGDNMPGLR